MPQESAWSIITAKRYISNLDVLEEAFLEKWGEGAITASSWSVGG